MQAAINAFLLGFPALFSIVNPVSGAFIFGGVTEGRTSDERSSLARRVAIYSLLVMMAALWAGSSVLAFFGITLAALRVAGGLVVALTAWDLLNRPEHREERKQEQAAPAAGADDIALFPMTIPITTGPGTIAVAVVLSASRPREPDVFAWFVVGTSAAAAALALVIWIIYRSSGRIVRLMGPTGSRTVTRLSAFLLLCIGVQILITGVEDVLGPLLTRHGYCNQPRRIAFMVLSMFQAGVPVITQLLNGLSGVVDKAAAHIAEKKLEESAFLEARLFPDMFTLGRQIRQATDFGRNAPGRLAGVELPSFPDADASFAEAKARIAKSLDFVKGFTPAQIDGTEEKDITWMAGQRQMSFKGQAYLLHFCLPHFFFHCTTAYNILRHNGVELGKRDYMGSL